MPQKKITLLIFSLTFPLIMENNQYIWGEGGGGAENQILLLVKNLVERDTIQVHVLSKRFNFRESSYAKIKNLNLIRIYAPNKIFLVFYFLFGLLNILKIHRKERIDVIHINEPSISLPLVYFIKRLFHIPVFQKFPSIYTKSFLSDNYYRQALPFLLEITKKFDKFQCISSQIFNSVLKLGFKPDTLIKIPNGINPKPYLTITRDPNKEIRKLVFIGRLVGEKGINLLIEAFNEAFLKFPHISLDIFGKGSEKDKIVKMIKKLNLEEKIHISSYNSEGEKLKILQEHDLFILPSFFEGMSNALLEALCSGMPVLVSDTKSNRELIKNEDNGILFKTGSQNSLKEKIIFCLNNNELSWKIGANGRDYCIKYFDIDVIEKRIFLIYIDLIKKGGKIF